jgi:hypothetical protein
MSRNEHHGGDEYSMRYSGDHYGVSQAEPEDGPQVHGKGRTI